MSRVADTNRKIRTAYLDLIWLAEQATPSWGAHIERGDPLTDPEMARWLEMGVIERVDGGYQITDKGRALINPREPSSKSVIKPCPTCGR